jgi:hypothetical protein
MSQHRPASLTILCWITIFFTVLLTPFALAALLDGYADLVALGFKLMANLMIVLLVALMVVVPLTAYFMLKAKNWARWLYAVLVLLDIAGTTYILVYGPSFSVASLIRAAVLAPISLIIVFLPSSNRYFAAGGRPWWKLQEESDRRG